MSDLGPKIYNLFKPAGWSSTDVVRFVKRSLPKTIGKIGHFGTLDPFASGVLLVGISGATRLNEYVHSEFNKTYIAIGKLGIETPTDDITSEIIQRDNTSYFYESIKSFSLDFIDQQIQDKFIGTYMQSPHKYSAAKFEGKALHQWAREGIEISKEPVKRVIYNIKVIKYAFPYLIFKAEVSSGTYIRTLFKDISNHLGTCGTLVALVRDSIGNINSKDSKHKAFWPMANNFQEKDMFLSPESVLNFPCLNLDEQKLQVIKNGNMIPVDQLQEIDNKINKNFWIMDYENNVYALGKVESNNIRPIINFKR